MMQMGLLAGKEKKEGKWQRQKKNEKISHFHTFPTARSQRREQQRHQLLPCPPLRTFTAIFLVLLRVPYLRIRATVSGPGVAETSRLQFKKRFPRAHKAYVDHCKAHAAAPEALLGTCLLLEDTAENSGAVFRIACLFTSVGNSSSLARIKRSPQDVIIRATQESMTDLGRQADEGVTISMPQINAGLFLCSLWGRD